MQRSLSMRALPQFLHKAIDTEILGWLKDKILKDTKDEPFWEGK